jgi:hypothetical protein
MQSSQRMATAIDGYCDTERHKFLEFCIQRTGLHGLLVQMGEAARGSGHLAAQPAQQRLQITMSCGIIRAHFGSSFSKSFVGSDSHSLNVCRKRAASPRIPPSGRF